MQRSAQTRYAIISAGTNSCRLLVAVSDDATGVLRAEYHETRGTRLGEGVNERRRLSAEAIDRTLAAVHDYAEIARGAARTFGIGTSALRDAENASTFADGFLKATGVALEILSGGEEAASSFEGALSGLRAAGRTIPAQLTVVDVGGGSTEFATRSAEGQDAAGASLQIGAVRLTERFLTGDPPPSADVERCRQAIRAALRDLPSEVRPRGSLVAVGGTASTAARMLQLIDESTAGGICDVAAADISALLKATLAMPVRERARLRGLPAQRADIFPAGLMIVDETVREAGAASLTVCQADLLLGYVSRHM